MDIGEKFGTGDSSVVVSHVPVAVPSFNARFVGNELRIDIPGAVGLQMAGARMPEVRVFDLRGHEVNLPRNGASLDASKLAPGVYMVRVRTSAGYSAALAVKK